MQAKPIPTEGLPAISAQSMHRVPPPAEEGYALARESCVSLLKTGALVLAVIGCVIVGMAL